MTDRTADLAAFADWTRQHITGDEKGQAQLFLDRFMQACGHKGVMEMGATLEMRVKKNDNRGTAFADFVWKPIVLIEIKRRGEPLIRHYRQAFDYWTHLVPGRPRYAMLCNFDEFWIYDFETQMDVPVDTIKIVDLPERFEAIQFLFPHHPAPRFGNHHEKVTRDAADRLATCFSKLMVRHVDREQAQRFILQLLVALFAEDIDLLPKGLVASLVDECKKPEDSYDLLGGLFEAMNTPGLKPGGRFKGVDYFNGGLFSQPARLELHRDEVAQLHEAANFNWSKVRPEIFGTLFEHSLDRGSRHAYGCHFTHPTDIMRIVGPTIVEPWRQLIENARTLGDLEMLRGRMQRYTVLDPACGSGNFLYLAYREMKRLEARLFQRLIEMRPAEKGQRQIAFVTARQFLGIDINPFAVEIAKVTMMIARKLAIDELHIDERPLPLDNLDANFIAGDALVEPILSGGEVVRHTLFADRAENPFKSGQIAPTKWPRSDVIIGNPPFLDARKMTMERGIHYAAAVRRLFPDVPGRADYCVFWFRKAHDHLPACTRADPVAGRAGLVGTQNIRNNYAREGGLDYIVQSGTIVEAVDNQPWSGEANVHVSIVNWVKRDAAQPARDVGAEERRTGREKGSRATRTAARMTAEASVDAAGRPAPAVPGTGADAMLLIPKSKRLWFKVEPRSHLDKLAAGEQPPDADSLSLRRKDKAFDLAYRETPSINSALSAGSSAAGARVLQVCRSPKRCFEGQQPGSAGFRLTLEAYRALREKEKAAMAVVFPYMNGTDLLTSRYHSNPKFIIDFDEMTLLEAQAYPHALRIVQRQVLPEWTEKAKKEQKALERDSGEHQNRVQTWWVLKRRRAELVRQVSALKRFIVCSRVTKRPIFCFISSEWRPDSSLTCFTFGDDYSFGILQSNAHWQWFITKCSKLKSDFRYTPDTVFDTFPWPQSPAKRHVAAIAQAGRAIRGLRDTTLPNMTGGLRALYRTLELPGRNPLRDAHTALDAAVIDAYGFDPRADLLTQLLELNLDVAARLDRKQPVTPPGIPPAHRDMRDLVSQDCIPPRAVRHSGRGRGA